MPGTATNSTGTSQKNSPTNMPTANQYCENRTRSVPMWPVIHQTIALPPARKIAMQTIGTRKSAGPPNSANARIM
jgi:hypothetical protein